MADLENLIDYISLTHDIREVKRAMWVKGVDQYENDSEHGYQIALAALYVIEHNNLDLGVYKAMALAVVHDLLEVYSGDTPVFGSDKLLATKQLREQEAIKNLKEKWPKLGLLHKLIGEYEQKETPESKFIYALDKLVPMLNNYLDSGRNWKRDGVTIGRIADIKTGKIDIDPTINDYYIDLMNLIKQNPELFTEISNMPNQTS